jgi:hypothetical protein
MTTNPNRFDSTAESLKPRESISRSRYQTIKLPKHLRDYPALFPLYVGPEYIIRGFYRGIVGWYAEDTADIHPPTPKELG